MASKKKPVNTNLFSLRRNYMQVPFSVIEKDARVVCCETCFDKTVYNPSYNEKTNGRRPASDRWVVTDERVLCPDCVAKTGEESKHVGDGSGSGDAASEPNGDLRHGRPGKYSVSRGSQTACVEQGMDGAYP